MTRYRVSADIGGTFTDLVVEPSDAAVFVDKVPTTPDNPARGVVEAVRRRIPDTSDVEFFVHGTTVGINAFLERKGERVLLITTQGHRDGYTIARHIDLVPPYDLVPPDTPPDDEPTEGEAAAPATPPG